MEQILLMFSPPPSQKNETKGRPNDWKNSKFKTERKKKKERLSQKDPIVGWPIWNIKEAKLLAFEISLVTLKIIQGEWNKYRYLKLNNSYIYHV